MQIFVYSNSQYIELLCHLATTAPSAGPVVDLGAGGVGYLVLAAAGEAHSGPNVLDCLLLPIAEHYI